MACVRSLVLFPEGSETEFNGVRAVTTKTLTSMAGIATDLDGLPCLAMSESLQVYC
jgi:hypothetical protein